MLPKVATHILHATSRAAASIQHQSHTIRNVLQLQSSSGPSVGTGNLAPWNNNGWGNHGPGTGGASYNPGSRFQNGYTVSLMRLPRPVLVSRDVRDLLGLSHKSTLPFCHPMTAP